MNKQRLLAWALVASVALNAAFALTHLLGRGSEPPRAQMTPPPVFRPLLRASAPQRQKIALILRRFRLDALGIKEEILTRRVEILEELGNPGYDPAKVREKAAELNKLEAEVNGRFVDALLEISEILDPRQRLELISRLGGDWYLFDSHHEKGGPHE